MAKREIVMDLLDLTDLNDFPLLRNHYRHIYFECGLRHKASGLYVHDDGLTTDEDYMYAAMNYAGHSVSNLFDMFVKENDLEWLSKMSADEFELISRVSQEHIGMTVV